MAVRTLPAEFEDLAAFAAEWALPTERQRNQKRLSSRMEDVQAFYDAMIARIDAILEYLDRLALDALPEPARRLYYLTLSLAEVAPAVELFHQPAVVDGFDPARFLPVDIPHMTPRES